MELNQFETVKKERKKSHCVILTQFDSKGNEVKQVTQSLTKNKLLKADTRHNVLEGVKETKNRVHSNTLWKRAEEVTERQKYWSNLH